MSRTVRETGKGRRWYTKESTLNRRFYGRKVRRQAAQAVVVEQFDDVPKPRGTQGWMTH